MEVMNEIVIERYPAYKDSGVEWLGEIPVDWDLLPNKYIFRLKKNEVGKRASEYTLLSLTLNGVIKRDMDNPQGKFPAEFDTYQEIKKGDFIFCLFDVEETPRTVGLSSYDGMITGAYTVVEQLPGFDRNFLYYFYLNLDFGKRMRPLYKGLRNTIPKDAFFSFRTFIPPLKEQTAIANFLDTKIVQIDKAIAQKEKLIALLKERRQILIHKVVTRGLNENVKMKDSGVEWIGEVPEHWEVKRLKYVLTEINLRSETGEEELLSLSKYKGVIPKSSLDERAGQANSLVGYKCVYPEMLVINKMQAVNGLLAVSKIYGITSPDYSVYKSSDQNVDINYIGFLLNQPEYLGEFKKVVTGVMEGFIRLYTDDLFRIYVALPAVEEQKLIIHFIDNLVEKTSNAIGFTEKEIDKLKEYKTVLINAAVTGKIKVS